HRVSILPRGGGTSLAGQTVGASLVIDFSRHMNKVLEVNLEEKWARVQPGVVLDELNAELAKHDLLFAPDPATSSRANVGGMIGNNSSGTKSIVWGKTVDHVLETTVLFGNGEVATFGEESPDEWEKNSQGETRSAEIHREFKQLIDSNREEVEARYPKVMRRVMGYNLDEFTHTDRWNLGKLFCGSEGTLAVLLEAKINLVPKPKAAAVCLAHYQDVLEAIRAVEPILAHGPSAVEILDKTVLDLARKNLSIRRIMDVVEGDPAAVLVVEFFGETDGEARRKAEEMAKDLPGRGLGYAYPIMTTPQDQAKVWNIRKNGLGIMLGIKGDRKPLPFIEDAAIPIKHLPEYIDRVLKFCKSIDAPVAMYAHASVGLIHVRPILDLRHQDDIERLEKISEEAFKYTVEYGGSWCGEHGDGYVRSPFIERFYGPKIYEAFKQIKRVFDPEGLMNPGKIIDSPPIIHDLRYGTDYEVEPFEMVYKFREEEGGFPAAVEMCTGVGACRKSNVGTMCPSYMATRDEQHSTRGRANALRLAMSGQFGPEGFTHDSLHEVLDLCLSCKGCKSECPSNVDMAKLKSEVLQRRHDRHGFTLQDKLIAGSSDAARRIAGWKAGMVNAIQGSWVFRKLLEGMAGFDSRRKLPPYASESLSTWFANRPPRNGAKQGKVALFADTYLNYQETRVGKAAVELLESCGYEVVLAEVGCCQRPKISHGMLREAKLEGEKTLRGLDYVIRQGMKVVVCEPSCASALTDDLPDLMDDQGLAQRVQENVMMIDWFLLQEIEQGRLEVELTSDAKKILIHGHCHQKALYGTDAMKKILGRIPNLEVSEIPSGCCGMAGSFGYEKRHYDISKTISEDRLMPAIRNKDSDTTVVACGFSCRHKIADFGGTEAVHWVEALRAKGRV
ncbi:MAG: FAD-binding protein, partial [Candidatus Omnitrophica bacterium]|nr:FAD-binding protein [Candidatus Omnitrophota bacterium]